MKKLMSITLGIFVFSIYGGVEDNIMVFLRQRETYRHVNANTKRKIENRRELITTLRRADTPDVFFDSLSEVDLLQEDSFEDNILMHTVPAALAYATQEFKDELLSKKLGYFMFRVDKCLFVALLEAGAHLDSPSRVITSICSGDQWTKDDYAFAKALLARGLNPNTAIDYWSHEHKYLEEHTKLAYIYNPKLAQLLVQYGADPKAVSSISKKTFLHLAAERNFYSPDLLQFYIDNGVDVNAKDSCGSTPLERIVLNKQSHLYSLSYLEKKVSILLENGAEYQQVQQLVDKKLYELANEDDPAYIAKYKRIEDILYAHDIYMQEAERLRTIDYGVETR